MNALVSPRIAALRQKLRQAEHAGQFFTADDVAGLIHELTAIGRGVKNLEDAVASLRRHAPRAAPPATRFPLGTLVFVPAGDQIGGAA